MAFKEVELSDAEKAALGGKFKKFEAIGDRLAGVFVRQEDRQGKFGPETVFVFRCKNESGVIEEVSLSSGGHTDAAVKLRKAALKPGNKVMISYASALDVGKQHPMKLFKVLVDTETTTASTMPAPAPKPVVPDDVDF